MIRVNPITESDIEPVADFLHVHLNARVRSADWARAIRVPWNVDAPNRGFMLVDGDVIGGVYLAFYSERVIDDRVERFCNLGAWCVLPQYRFHSLRLLNALLAQEGYTFTDLSPSGHAVPINTRLKFRRLDTTTVLIPNIPWPSWPGSHVISSDPQLIEQALSGRDLELYRDHAQTSAARHLVLIRGQQSCYVVFRKDRRKKLPLFASILHVSNPELFRKMVRPLACHLLFRHAAMATLAEVRVVMSRPSLSWVLPSPRPKMFKSQHLEPDHIDYLYSELVCVAW